MKPRKIPRKKIVEQFMRGFCIYYLSIAYSQSMDQIEAIIRRWMKEGR